MLKRILLVKLVLAAGLLVAACNPIPEKPTPTPVPTTADRNPMQMDVYDFASWLARTDIHGDESIGIDRYVDALLTFSTCLGEGPGDDTGQQELPPGEVAASQWWTISIWTNAFIEGLLEEPIEGIDPSYISVLEAMNEICLED